MSRILTCSITAVIAVSLSGTVSGQSCGCADPGCTSGCCKSNCGCDGEGGVCCVGKAELVSVDKHCWKIECEDICVPSVRFPWERGGSPLRFLSSLKKEFGGCSSTCCDGNGCASGCQVCCPPDCDFSVTVKNPKKHTFECKECEYSLEPADGGKGCSNGACAASPTAAYEIAPQPDVPKPPAEPTVLKRDKESGKNRKMIFAGLNRVRDFRPAGFWKK